MILQLSETGDRNSDGRRSKCTGRTTKIAAHAFVEVLGIGYADLISDSLDRNRGVREEMFGPFQSPPTNIFSDSCSDCEFEKAI